MKIATFTFNGFGENTYVLYDETKECVIVDPGCSTAEEEAELVGFIESNALTPIRLLNTHCHIDHILGNAFVAEKYGLTLEAHQGEEIVLQMGTQVSTMYGIPYRLSPAIGKFLEDGGMVEFGETKLEILLTPGHSPASVSFFDSLSMQLIAGDVLFYGSIGRTDLPGGDYDTLIQSIETKYYPLGDDVKVYPGHGQPTTIGYEKMTNPFLRK